MEEPRLHDFGLLLLKLGELLPIHEQRVFVRETTGSANLNFTLGLPCENLEGLRADELEHPLLLHNFLENRRGNRRIRSEQRVRAI